MQTQSPTFWPLNGSVDPRDGGRAGWRIDQIQNLAASQIEVRLAADPDGPLDWDWPDDSLGGLTLPKGMALDAGGLLYLLCRSESQVKRFDPITRRFHRLLGVGGAGTDARQFGDPVSIAIAGGNLYVAEKGNRRVQVFDLNSLMLRYMWMQAGWKPIDLAVHAGGVYILDARGGRVFHHAMGRDELTLIVSRPEDPDRWRRIAVGRQGKVYLLQKSKSQARLDVYDPRAKCFGVAIEDAGDVRDFFDPPAIRLFYPQKATPFQEGRFCLPQGLGRACDRHAAPASLERPLLPCVPLPRPASAAAYSWRQQDFKDLAALATRLREACDPVSLHIKSRLDEKTRTALTGWTSGPLNDALHRLLTWELNRLLKQADLYSTGAFAKVPLSEEAQALARTQPSGIELVRLNRMLLEEAYLEALARSPHTAPPPLVFYREGEPAPFDPAEATGPALYQRKGYWVTRALDSRKYRCQWHRIELDLASLPPGSQVSVSTYAADQDDGSPSADSLAWQPGYAFVGELQRPTGTAQGKAADRRSLPDDFLVQSHEGQYLWLKIELQGDGFNSPAVKGIRVHFPRESYLQYLPAIYSADDQSRYFLERFLSIFQTEWDAIEERIEESAALFDPAAVPADGGSLEALAGFLAAPLEGEWTQEQKRELLKAIPQVYLRRGTVEGLRAYLRPYVLNMTGLSQEELDHFSDLPAIVEGFRERRRLMLAQPGDAELGLSTQLWGPGEVGRLQLGGFSTVGEVRMVSTGDPTRELFEEFAHRFRVVIPAAWVRTADDERMLRRALDMEKPTQSSYDLCLVEPRFRVGVQSTVGLDTIVGAYQTTRLACAAGSETAPDSLRSQRLGVDTVLGGQAALPLQLAPDTRIGIDTTLR